ncbi:DUF6098 family protein [Streptomyces sp. NPDC046862]|uniref:DUF6098 family protein n=1 Tax=Streptomyces sp. NPDC046862 TaxID=3154603 RepID=UPI0034566ED8
MSTPEELPVVRTLGEVAALVESIPLESIPRLYVRWSHGPEADRRAGESRDGLTGVRMPGLSANPLEVEPWWEDRPVELWVARRLYDYSHLPRDKGPGVRPWILTGHATERGPDNEPLVHDVEPVGWIDERVVEEAESAVAGQEGRWETMRSDDR